MKKKVTPKHISKSKKTKNHSVKSLLANKYPLLILAIISILLVGGLMLLTNDKRFEGKKSTSNKTSLPNSENIIPSTYISQSASQAVISTPSPTPAPTLAPEFSVISVSPIYFTMNYAQDGKGNLVINGSNFKNGLMIELLGPYTSDGGAIGTASIYSLSNITVNSQTQATGTINSGLPNGYFKVVVTNGDAKQSQNFYILRGNDPNEH